MQWHTDNQTDREFAYIPGTIFITLMSDVEDDGFQYARGPQVWSGEKTYNDYSDQCINENFHDDVLGFRGPAGMVVIYNMYGIHRAKPVTHANFVRKSLFWQVDAEVNSAGPLLINPEFFPTLGEGTRLGFGLPSGYEMFPTTGIETFPLNRLGLGPAQTNHLVSHSVH